MESETYNSIIHSPLLICNQLSSVNFTSVLLRADTQVKMTPSHMNTIIVFILPLISCT
jgi:hypothetical protein